jgi:hypothetical protein
LNRWSYKIRLLFWNPGENGIDARHRIEDIEAGIETDDELADAKRYLNEVLQEVCNMEKIAIRSEPQS